MSNGYDDIIGLSRPVSEKRVRMSRLTRAAQFAPFAALTGYEGVIRETERLTETEIEMMEGAQEQLNEKLLQIRNRIDTQPTVRLKCFQRDLYKSGGSYITVTGRVKRIDEAGHTLYMTDGEKIPFGCIFGIETDIFGE